MIPEAGKYFHWGTPERRLYDFLSCGPATGSQIARKLKIRSPGRIVPRIRKGIAGTGVTVKVRLIDEGEAPSWEYRLGTESIECR